MTLLCKNSLLAIFMPHMKGSSAEQVAVNFAKSFVQRNYPVDMVLLSATCKFLADLLFGVRVVDANAWPLLKAPCPLAQYQRQSRPVTLGCMWPFTVVAPWAHTLVRMLTRMVKAGHTVWSQDSSSRGAQ